MGKFRIHIAQFVLSSKATGLATWLAPDEEDIKGFLPLPWLDELKPEPKPEPTLEPTLLFKPATLEPAPLPVPEPAITLDPTPLALEVKTFLVVFLWFSFNEFDVDLELSDELEADELELELLEPEPDSEPEESEPDSLDRDRLLDCLVCEAEDELTLLTLLNLLFLNLESRSVGLIEDAWPLSLLPGKLKKNLIKSTKKLSEMLWVKFGFLFTLYIGSIYLLIWKFLSKFFSFSKINSSTPQKRKTFLNSHKRLQEK